MTVHKMTRQEVLDSELKTLENEDQPKIREALMNNSVDTSGIDRELDKLADRYADPIPNSLVKPLHSEFRKFLEPAPQRTSWRSMAVKTAFLLGGIFLGLLIGGGSGTSTDNGIALVSDTVQGQNITVQKLQDNVERYDEKLNIANESVLNIQAQLKARDIEIAELKEKLALTTATVDQEKFNTIKKANRHIERAVLAVSTNPAIWEKIPADTRNLVTEELVAYRKENEKIGLMNLPMNEQGSGTRSNQQAPPPVNSLNNLPGGA